VSKPGQFAKPWDGVTRLSLSLGAGEARFSDA